MADTLSDKGRRLPEKHLERMLAAMDRKLDHIIYRLADIDPRTARRRENEGIDLEGNGDAPDLD